RCRAVRARGFAAFAHCDCTDRGRLRVRAVRRAVRAGSQGVVTGRGGTVGHRHGAGTIGRRAVTDRIAGFAAGGGVIAVGIRAGIAVFTAGGGEVLAGFFSDLRDRVELVQVHRIGALGPGGDVGDLTLVARV